MSFALNLFFFTYPLSWTAIGVEKTQLWQVYLIIFLPSVLFVFPYMRRVEKTGHFRRPIMFGWLSATVGYGAYLFGAQYDIMLYISGAAFFFGYSIYQPILPAFLTQRVPASGRGTASGVYNFSGFIGSSLGGMLGGALTHLSPSLPEFVGVHPARGLVSAGTADPTGIEFLTMNRLSDWNVAEARGAQIFIPYLARSVVVLSLLAFTATGRGGSYDETISGVTVPVPKAMAKNSEKPAEMSFFGFGAGPRRFMAGWKPIKSSSFTRRSCRRAAGSRLMNMKAATPCSPTARDCGQDSDCCIAHQQGREQR